MSMFDVFRRKKEIPAPWSKYYTEEEMNIEIPNISMYDQINKTALKYPNYIAYQYFNKKVKYKKFMKQIDRAALSFRELGINKGDIITICMPNIPEALISLYALNKLGAIAKMLHPLSAEEEIKESLIFTKSRYLIMIDMFYNKIKNNIDETNVEKVIFVSAADSMNIFMNIGYKLIQINKYEKYPHNKKFIRFNKFKSYSLFKKNEEFTKFGKDTPAVILHSGGTSGTPKNVVIQNRTFVMSAIQEKIALKRLKPGDSCLAILPNFHGFGLSV